MHVRFEARLMPVMPLRGNQCISVKGGLPAWVSVSVTCRMGTDLLGAAFIHFSVSREGEEF